MENLSYFESLTPRSELDSDRAHPVITRNRASIERVLTWARDYLCKPHPELGREGPVCPYVSRSLAKDLFFFAVYDKPQVEQAQVHQLLLSFRDRFLETEPKTGDDAIFKSFLILFPNIPIEDAPRVIDDSQQALITRFTPHGLMIGEFHPKPPDKRGLWSPDFRPLDCPVPLLAVRHMVNTDILFLKGNQENVENYLRIHGKNPPPRMYPHINEALVQFKLDHPLFKRDAVGSV